VASAVKVGSDKNSTGTLSCSHTADYTAFTKNNDFLPLHKSHKYCKVRRLRKIKQCHNRLCFCALCEKRLFLWLPTFTYNLLMTYRYRIFVIQTLIC